MAKQRQTDININYKVNTVDVEKGNAVLNRASQSTDQLRAATQNFGTQAGKSFQSASKYIEGMEIELARLRQQIKLTNTQDTARLQQLSNQYKSLKQQIDAYNKSLFESNKATKAAAADTKNLASQFGEVYSAVRLFIAAGIAREIVNINLEMAKLSGNVEGVQRAFEKQVPNSVGLLNQLRAATQNSVTDLELMQKTLQAQNFGIDVQRLPELLEFAAIRAQQTGVSVDYLVNSIVTGIGRKSILILDNLGISATRLKGEFNGAALAAQSVGDVTNAVADIAQEEMRKMGGFVSTAATEVDQLTVSWHDLRVEASKFFTEGAAGGINGLLKSYVDSFKAWIEAHNRGIDVSEVFAEQQRKEIARISENEFVNRVFTKSKEENIKIIEEEIRLLTRSIGSWTAFRDLQFDVVEALKEERDELQKRQLTEFFFGKENLKRLKELEEQISLNERLVEAKREDTLIDQEILKLLQGRLIAMRRVNDETEREIELRDKILGPDTLSDRKKPAKTPFVPRVIDKQELVDLEKQIQDALNQVFIVLPVQVKPNATFEPDAWQKIGEEFAENWRSIVSSGIDDTTNLINSFVQKNADSYDIQLSQLRAFYDEQMNLAGNNERAKMELAIKRDREEQKLRKKAFEADKEAKRLQTIINGAAGVINAFATLPYPAALVASVLIAGKTATELAIINNQQYNGYKDGVIDLKGPGTKTSDSIPARLSKGESVMTADETASSKGIFKAVRARKLNDKVLKEITSGRSGGQSVQSFDDSRLLKKLDEVKNATPDVKRVGNLMYETKVKTDTYKQWVRSKSMNS